MRRPDLPRPALQQQRLRLDEYRSIYEVMSEQQYDLVDSKHPIHTVLHEDVKVGITACIESGAYMSAAKLIYAGIDLMAYLCMPEKSGKEQHHVHKRDYVKWIMQYLIFDEFLNITADDIHQARHAAVHRHSLENKPGSRHIVLTQGPVDLTLPVPPEFTGGVDCVFVSVRKFADIFFQAIDQCVINVHQDREKLKLMEQRFNNVAQVHSMSHEKMLKLVDALIEYHKPK